MKIIPDQNPALFARAAVAAALKHEPMPESPDEDFYRQRAACFVSIKMDGALRGCIGTLEPAEPSLGGEIIRNAQSAAFADPRFNPLSPAELPRLKFSVDVLSAAEQVNSHAELDSKKYGVIVSCDYRRGVLLPDLDGVESVEHQLQIACQKAGIAAHEVFQAHRFTVVRYDENWQSDQPQG
ncbi:MAG: AmmeMemoRadiSam system protein A [Actinomycetota bacterium]|nr:AmmeMemoRadiSam system protein A [Actinomycetota bacterium]